VNETTGMLDGQLLDIGFRARLMLSRGTTIIAIIICFVAILGNFSSLAAFTQVRRRLSSYSHIIISLIVSDLLTVMSVALFIMHKIINTNFLTGSAEARLQSSCMFLCIQALNTTGLISTLFNLMTMALDNYVAIIKPLHHHCLLTKRRISIMIAGMWCVSLFIGFSDFLSGIHGYNTYIYQSQVNYCEYVILTPYEEEFALYVIAFICLTLMLCIYIKIYITVHQQQKRRSHQIQKKKKALVTTLLILGSFILCWIPTCIFEITCIILRHTHPEYTQKTYTTWYQIQPHLFNLVLINSVCDPIVYGIRLNEMKNGYKILYYKLCYCMAHGKLPDQSIDMIITRYNSSIRSTRSSSCKSSQSQLSRSNHNNSAHGDDCNRHEQRNFTALVQESVYKQIDGNTCTIDK
jgi:hypothetical protein